MKTFSKTVLLTLAVAGLAFTSCKKDSSNDPQNADESGMFSQQSGDENNAATMADMSMDDAEIAMSGSSMSHKTASFPGLCNAIVDTANISAGAITITYTGTSCDGLRSRSGSITAQIVNYPTVHWKDAGAVMTITYTNFKVTSLITNKSVTLNGTHTITNVTGGLVARIGISPNPSAITRKIRSSNMSLTFDDGTQRTWSVARRRTWTGTSGNATSLTIAGDTNVNSNPNTAEWGINRAGNAFSTAFSTPVTLTSACGWYAPTGGVKMHCFNSRTATVTFGTDANGNPSPSGCPNHYKISWTSLAGAQKTYIGTY